MPNVHVLAFHDDIDISRKRWLEGELEQIKHLGPNATAILDLSDVQYLDTTFLNCLLRVRAHLADEQPDEMLCIVASRQNPVSRLFEITHLDEVFRIFEDLASARQFAYGPIDTKRGTTSVEARSIRRSETVVANPREYPQSSL